MASCIRCGQSISQSVTKLCWRCERAFKEQEKLVKEQSQFIKQQQDQAIEAEFQVIRAKQSAALKKIFDSFSNESKAVYEKMKKFIQSIESKEQDMLNELYQKRNKSLENLSENEINDIKSKVFMENLSSIIKSAVGLGIFIGLWPGCFIAAFITDSNSPAYPKTWGLVTLVLMIGAFFYFKYKDGEKGYDEAAKKFSTEKINFESELKKIKMWKSKALEKIDKTIQEIYELEKEVEDS